MSDPAPPVVYVSVSNVIIDDIVLWDGRTAMATLGGSGTHAVAGMRWWHAGPLGLSAYVGADLPVSMRQALKQLGVDSAGLVAQPGAVTPRAWQLFEKDGLRTEVFRTSLPAFRALSRTAIQLPASYWRARGFHVIWGATLADATAFLQQLRTVNAQARIVLEPLEDWFAEAEANWRPLLAHVDAFVLNWVEGRQLSGLEEPERIAEWLQALGAAQIVIGLGAQGALVKARDGGAWRLAAVPVTVVDETGAGNALCGGLLTGLGAGLGLVPAVQRGMVSASFALEQFGAPEPNQTRAACLASRLQGVRAGTAAC